MPDCVLLLPHKNSNGNGVCASILLLMSHAQAAARAASAGAASAAAAAAAVPANEPLYCTCRRPYIGQMVACENEDCEVRTYVLVTYLLYCVTLR